MSSMINPSVDSDSDLLPVKVVIKRLLGYFKSHFGMMWLTLFATLFVGVMESVVALAGALLIELFSAISQSIASDTPIFLHAVRELAGVTLWDFTLEGNKQAANLLWLLSLGTITLVFVKGVIYFSKEFVLWRITHRVIMRIKRDLAEKIITLPQSTFDKQRSGELISRITWDVSQLGNAIRTGILLIKSLVYAVIFVAVMFAMEWSLTLLAVAVFPVSVMLIKLFGERVRRMSGLMSKNVADYTAFLGEVIGGAKVIKAFGREEAQKDSFKEKFFVTYRQNMKIAKLDSFQSPLQDVLSTIGMVAVIMFCGYRMLSGAMNIGDLSGFIFLLVNAYKPIKKLGETNTVIQRAIASGSRIFSLLDMPSESDVIRSGSLKPAQVNGQLQFVGVTFSYDDVNLVLNNINLEVGVGQTLALVGPSGSGKSTLVNLIPRFYPLKSGRIIIDETNITEWDLAYLRQFIAIVPQETALFAGTILDNIRFGNPMASDDEINEVTRAANVDAFVKQLPKGYETEVGERGMQLSGGQRQRIAIARAMLRDPRILLLDEATSSLDSESEHLIQEALERLRQNRTTIVIAHRLSTVQSADRIAVLVNGEIAELGTHQDLYDKGGVYRRLYEMQFSG